MSTRQRLIRNEVRSDQHCPRQARQLLRTTPFEKVLILVVKESQFCLVFLVPSVPVGYRYLPSSSPLSPCHWLPRCHLRLYACCLLVDWGGYSLSAHCALAEDVGCGIIGRRLSYSPGPKDRWAHRNHPHKHDGSQKVLCHRPRQREGVRGGSISRFPETLKTTKNRHSRRSTATMMFCSASPQGRGQSYFTKKITGGRPL